MTNVKSFSKFKKTKIICRNTILCVSNLVFVFCFILVENHVIAQGQSNCPGPAGIWKIGTITFGNQSTSTFSPCGDHRVGIGVQFASKQLHVFTSHGSGLQRPESHSGIRLEDITARTSPPGVLPEVITLRSLWDIEPNYSSNDRPQLRINTLFGTTLKTVLTLTDTGNVGIGTTNPTGILHIVQGDINRFRIGTGGDIQTEGANGTGWNNFGAADALFPILTVQNNLKSEVMRVTSAGNVGIGTTNPQQQLSVSSSANSVQIQLQRTNGSISGVVDVGTTDGDFRVYPTGYSQSQDKLFIVTSNGNVGIGTTLNLNPNNYKLAVNGIIGAKDLWIENTSNTWPDYVFEDNYKLITLEELALFLNKNKALPNMSSKDIIKSNNTIPISEVLLRQQIKIEELTLYLIELNKKVEQLEKKK